MFVSIDHNLRIYLSTKISVCHCARAHEHKHIRVYLLPSCHILSVWQGSFLICTVGHSLRYRGRAASGHQGNVLNLSWEPLHGAAAPLDFTSLWWRTDSLSFFRHPNLLTLPSAPHTPTALKQCSFCPLAATHFCLMLKRLIRTTFVGQRLRVRANSLKRACE